MKYVCFGFVEEKAWENISDSDRDAMMKACFAYDEMLKQKGHMVGGEALQSVRSATTVRWRNGRAVITDGPFAETKEHLGGILFLEARDLNEAIQLISQHPGIRYAGGGFEIRPTEPLPPAYGPEHSLQ